MSDRSVKDQHGGAVYPSDLRGAAGGGSAGSGDDMADDGFGQAQAGQSHGLREQEPVTVDKVSVIETGSEGEMPAEVAEYMEKVEKENLELDRPVIHHGVAVVDSPYRVSGAEVVLPVDRPTLLAGLKKPVSDSLRWLATWCLRIIKKFGGRVLYSGQSETHDYLAKESEISKRSS